MFSITSDPATKLLAITYSGFVDAETVSASFNEEQRLVAAMQCKSLEHLLLVDGRALAVLSQPVVAHIVAALASRPLRARRAAVLAGSALSNMQLKRIISQESNVRIFAVMEEAMSWLLTDP